MKTSELAKLLGVSVKRIDEWCREGMPCLGPRSKRKRQFDPPKVYQWLVAGGHAVPKPPEEPPVKSAPPPPRSPISSESDPPNGRVADGRAADGRVADGRVAEGRVAEREGLVLRTRAECAQYFGVHLRTVATWLTDATFPGHSGDKGAQNGYFPVMPIFLWLQKQSRQRTVEPNPTRQQLDEVKLEQARQKLRQDRGELVSLDLVVQQVQRAQTIAINRLMALPDMLIEFLPADMDARLKDDYYDRAMTEVRQACQSIGRALREDDADTA